MSDKNDELFEVRLSATFRDWLDGIADDVAAAAVAERLLRMRRGLFGDHASIGDKVSELRIHYGAGYRAYFTLRGRQVVILLVGGTKRTQARDIRRATAMAQQL
jgi:putative addiction module killer protein